MKVFPQRSPDRRITHKMTPGNRILEGVRVMVGRVLKDEGIEPQPISQEVISRDGEQLIIFGQPRDVEDFARRLGRSGWDTFAEATSGQALPLSVQATTPDYE